MAAPSTSEILAARPGKHPVDPWRPYAYLVELERTEVGRIEPVATIFLTNRECPLRCLMCDLWRNTTDDPVPLGAIPRQIDYALERLPAARRIKLYNSGNFFDRRAIPPEDHPAIAERVRQFDRVIVENHPRWCDERVVQFREQLDSGLEVALGLETIHPEVLPRLNKQMTADDFRRAAEFLVDHGIAVRTFILLRPPWLDEAEGVEWAVRSIEFAFECGADCCAVIPTRGGNGIMERLAREGVYRPPRIESLEAVMESVLPRASGRLFADLWDAESFSTCDQCAAARIERLRRMNETQQVAPRVECDCERAV